MINTCTYVYILIAIQLMYFAHILSYCKVVRLIKKESFPICCQIIQLLMLPQFRIEQESTIIFVYYTKSIVIYPIHDIWKPRLDNWTIK